MASYTQRVIVLILQHTLVNYYNLLNDLDRTCVLIIVKKCIFIAL